MEFLVQLNTQFGGRWMSCSMGQWELNSTRFVFFFFFFHWWFGLNCVRINLIGKYKLSENIFFFRKGEKKESKIKLNWKWKNLLKNVLLFAIFFTCVSCGRCSVLCGCIGDQWFLRIWQIRSIAKWWQSIRNNQIGYADPFLQRYLRYYLRKYIHSGRSLNASKMQCANNVVLVDNDTTVWSVRINNKEL